jgi:hypothetical protein
LITAPASVEIAFGTASSGFDLKLYGKEVILKSV